MFVVVVVVVVVCVRENAFSVCVLSVAVACATPQHLL